MPSVWVVNSSQSLFLQLNPALVLLPYYFISPSLPLSVSLPPLSLAQSHHLHLSFSFRHFPLCRVSLLAFLLTLSHTHFISI